MTDGADPEPPGYQDQHTHGGRSGRSVSEGGRYSSASAAPRSDQESRSATVWPGLAFRWKAGMTPSP